MGDSSVRRAVIRTHHSVSRAVIRTHHSVSRAVIRTHHSVSRAVIRTHHSVSQAVIKTYRSVSRRCRNWRSLTRYGLYIGLFLLLPISFLFSQNVLRTDKFINSTASYNQELLENNDVQLESIPEDPEDEHYWRNQTIGQSLDIFVFSAHQDTRDHSRLIRVLGLARHKLSNKKVSCVGVDRAGNVLVLDVDIRQNKEHFGLEYSSYFFNCNAIRHVNFNPIKVGLVEYVYGRQRSLHHPPSNVTWVPVLNQQQDDWRATNITGGFAVCVKPLYNRYDRPVWLVEFMELYSLLGVDHFVFYNHSVGAGVEAVLKHYQRLGRATVLPWDLPLVSQRQVRTEAMFTALNDCSYRLMYKFKYAVIVDLDEFIIPTKHLNYAGLLAEIDKTHFGTFIFKNCFFYLTWENDTRASALPRRADATETFPYLVSLYKTRRLVQEHRHGTRSKYIVKPNRVVELGNHNVWTFIRGARSMKVDPELGLSHHYRICEFGGRDCLSKASKVDNTTHRWGGPLLTAVLRKCQVIFEAEICPEDPPYEEGIFS